ncbi:MAG: hypothetical protein QOI91_403, partial [Solirubrobacteraceae bacterium]|nr:hypothetical protein [Solirubrobacteraceae bacterium]
MRKFVRKPAKPSPAMVVALVALAFAMTGSAAAAVSFAINAGAVDGKSAVAAGSSNAFAAGKLVATRRTGVLKGTIPAKFLDPAAGQSLSFGTSTDVIDNAGQAPFVIASIPGFGTLQATCGDQKPAAGVEDPTTTVTFTNTSGVAMNFARALGTGQTAVSGLVPNQTASFVVNGSNTYVINLLKQGTSLLVNGVVRQDGANSASAFCVNY